MSKRSNYSVSKMISIDNGTSSADFFELFVKNWFKYVKYNIYLKYNSNVSNYLNEHAHLKEWMQEKYKQKSFCFFFF